MNLNLKHATKEQFLDKFRELFFIAEGQEVWRLSAMAQSLIDDGEYTADEIATKFHSDNTTKKNALKSRFKTEEDKYYDLKKTKGE